MASFEMPDFYMPWPARCNRHVDATRAHTAAWARQIGLFEEGNAAGWTEARFDRADYALFVGLVHPDAPRRRLDAVCDYYVWAFYLDDLIFASFGPACDIAGARELIARLLEFMPVDPTAATPVPSVLVAQRFLDCELQEAVDAIDHLVAARLEAFEDVVRRELPETDDPDAAARLAGGLRDWLAGALSWSRVTGRYDA